MQLVVDVKDDLIQSLKEYLKKNQQIKNIYGVFNLKHNSLGQGGTSIVKEFEFNQKSYAIKFLLENIIKNESKAFKRFKQAHLNLSEIQNSEYILPQIHLDSLKINENIQLPYIIMLKADQTLKAYIKNINIDINLFEILFNNLLNAVGFIHQKKIIHRDLKPENIFIFNQYLILGDFDIAKFNDPDQIKLINTKESEKLANYSFSAPEQSEKKFDEIDYSADWYAVGQILYWLLKGVTLRGQEDISFDEYSEDFRKYASLIRKLLSQKSDDRLKSKQEIIDFLEQEKKVTWEQTLDNFDENIIFKYMSELGFSYHGVKEFKDEQTIFEIMQDLSNNVDKLSLWRSQGFSDLYVYKIIKSNECKTCYFIDNLEMKIKSIWIFKYHNNFGGSTLIIETDELKPLLFKEAKDYDYYGLFNKHIIKPEEVEMGWAFINNKRVKLDDSSKRITRIITKTIYFLAPKNGPLIINAQLIHNLYSSYNKEIGLSEAFLEPLKEMKRGGYSTI